MSLTLQNLQTQIPMVDSQGRPSVQFQRFWQASIGKIVQAINDAAAAQAAADDAGSSAEETRAIALAAAEQARSEREVVFVEVTDIRAAINALKADFERLLRSVENIEALIA